MIKKKQLKKVIKITTKKLTNSAIFNKILSAVIYSYVILVEKTTIWNKPPKTVFNKKGGAILCSWHSRIIMPPTFKDKNRNVFALVSLHRDGQIIADLLKKFGFTIIGGSTNKNAKAAAVNIMKALKKQETVAIIPDGPRGPAQKMTLSSIYFASKTGCPIIACAYSTKRALIIKKSWDNLMVPLPFSRGSFVLSRPFRVPKNLTEEQLEEYRQKFESLLNKTTQKADKLAGRKEE